MMVRVVKDDDMPYLDLLSYLRAHCLVMYDGPNFQKIKMTEPTVLEFEILVLEQYQRIIELVVEARRAKGLQDYYDELSSLESINEGLPDIDWRKKFIATYRTNQMRILSD